MFSVDHREALRLMGRRRRKKANMNFFLSGIYMLHSIVTLSLDNNTINWLLLLPSILQMKKPEHRG